MKVILTVTEIMDRGLWIEFCEMKGINEWSVNEGRLDGEEEFVFSKEEAQKLGLLPEPD